MRLLRLKKGLPTGHPEPPPDPLSPLFASRKTSHKLISEKTFIFFIFPSILTILKPPASIFSQFLVRKHMPGGHFFSDLSKTVILAKSCSHCGNNTILKGCTRQKSVQGATPNDTGKKKRQKAVPVSFLDACFGPRVRFLARLSWIGVENEVPEFFLKPYISLHWALLRRSNASGQHYLHFCIHFKLL